MMALKNAVSVCICRDVYGSLNYIHGIVHGDLGMHVMVVFTTSPEYAGLLDRVQCISCEMYAVEWAVAWCAGRGKIICVIGVGVGYAGCD